MCSPNHCIIFQALPYLEIHGWLPNPHLHAMKGKWSTLQCGAKSPHPHMANLPSLYLNAGWQPKSENLEEHWKESLRTREQVPKLSGQKSTWVAMAGRRVLSAGSDGQRDRHRMQGLVLARLLPWRPRQAWVMRAAKKVRASPSARLSAKQGLGSCNSSELSDRPSLRDFGTNSDLPISLWRAGRVIVFKKY